MNKLTYTNFADLKADFDKGVVFNVIDRGVTHKVVRIVIETEGVAKIFVKGDPCSYGGFNPDGTNRVNADKFRLVTATVVPAPSPAKFSATVAFQKSFLDRFAAGEEFHNAQTRETVVDVKFERGHNRLTVTLADETGKRRTTPRYNVDGTHKFQSNRNLKAGRLPPKEVDVNVTIYKHAFNGSLFVIRQGEVIPNIRGISNATKVGETVIREKQ